MTRKERVDVEKLLTAAVEREHTFHHRALNGAWKRRLCLSALITGVLVGAAWYFKLDLPAKGAEFVLAAATHWLLFGNAE